MKGGTHDVKQSRNGDTHANESGSESRTEHCVLLSVPDLSACVFHLLFWSSCVLLSFPIAYHKVLQEVFRIQRLRSTAMFEGSLPMHPC